MIRRELYLSQLMMFRDKPLIKVITGVRRCGKSSILSLFSRELLDSGVAEEQIIQINFESYDYLNVTDFRELHTLIKDRREKSELKHYILLDEIQQVEAWEKEVNSLFLDPSVDIYITGSNAYLLSAELSTLLSGRYVEIEMQPLSFQEYLTFVQDDTLRSIDEKFSRYLEYGSLPPITDLLDTPQTIPPFLDGVYNTVIVKDVMRRHKVRDTVLLESLLRYIAAHIGCTVSTKKICDYLTSTGRTSSHETIDNYLAMLEQAFIIYKANRYDMKGKMFLKTYEKYYMVDTGLRNRLTGLKNTDYGRILENIVFLELLRRGYEVSIGKINNLEVDFIAEKTDERIYYQVSATIMDEDTRARELRPLAAIDDNYPKVVLTMDRTVYNDFSGIRVMNILDFLLERS